MGCGESAGPAAPPPSPPEDPLRFPGGIQASDADATSVRLTAKAASERLVAVVQGVGEFDVTPGPADCFRSVDVQGLSPGTEYRYRFDSMDADGSQAAASVTGRFRTLPDADAVAHVPLVFGASACTHHRWAPWPSLPHASSAGLDLHLLLGDTVYADGATTLEAYRESWAFSYASDSYQSLRASTGIYATWDDHEVGNNWRHHPDDDPPREEGRNRQTLVGPTRFAAARQAFKEHAGLRDDRIWRSVRWGATAEFFILDCRGERLWGDGDTDRSYLGRDQMDWLKAGLTGSTAHWKFIVNSVPILSIPEINAVLGDGWIGFPEDRTEILDHIDGKIPGVVWISGDYHTFVVGQVEPESDKYPGQYDVLVGHGGSIANPVVEAIAGNDTEGRFLAADMRPGAVVFSASPPGGDDLLTIRYIGDDGDTLHEVLLPYTSV